MSMGFKVAGCSRLEVAATKGTVLTVAVQPRHGAGGPLTRSVAGKLRLERSRSEDSASERKSSKSTSKPCVSGTAAGCQTVASLREGSLNASPTTWK
jgi:hypothetical protein